MGDRISQHQTAISYHHSVAKGRQRGLFLHVVMRGIVPFPTNALAIHVLEPLQKCNHPPPDDYMPLACSGWIQYMSRGAVKQC